MDTDAGARVCDTQQLESLFRLRWAAAHRAALQARFKSVFIRVHPWLN
jgi:hypothetical protein